MRSLLVRLASFAAILGCVACGSTDPNLLPDDAGGGTVGSGGGSTAPAPDVDGGTDSTGDACPAMCEETVVTLVSVETGGACSAPAYVVGQSYSGGQTVSLDGSEYTSKYWTDTSPAGSDGGDASAWSAPTVCPGSGTTMQEVETTKLVCCAAADGGAGGSDGGVNAGGCILDQYLPGGAADFATIMAAPWPNPQIHPVFDDAYTHLCDALEYSGFANFGQGGTDEQNKREVAAFLANVAVETAYLQDSAQNADYTSTAFTVGRGAIQLTYDYNYQAAADYLGDQSIMSDPRLVATDPLLVWETALWFWLHYENPSVQAPNNCHEAIKAGDFGRTLRIIKGDCGSHADRISAYQKGIDLMGVTAGDITCEG